MSRWSEDEDFDLDLDFLDSRTTPKHPLRDPRLIAEFLSQGEAWQPARGDFVSISSMTPAHALATVGFLLNRATQLAVVLAASGGVPLGFATDPLESRRWLIQTDLVRSLFARGQQTVEPAVPWAVVSGDVGARR